MKEYLLKLIKELCEIEGVSGDEGKVAEYITEKIDGCCEYRIDPLGNVIGKKGKGGCVFLDAHTDEVGFIVKNITSDGLPELETVGGIDERILPDTAVTVNGRKGVICCKPVHLMKADERSKARPSSELVADIGAESREEAERIVKRGDKVAFARNFELFGENDNYILSPALDDRVGCAILIALIVKTDLNFDFSFSCQEEVGCRGASVAAISSNADIALAVETTTAADVDGVEESKQVCFLNKGAVISFMDRSTLYDRNEFDFLLSVAKENGINVQTKNAVAGGNDMGTIHKAGEGKKAVSVSVPARYLHSPAVAVSVNDVLSAYETVTAYIREKNKGIEL